MHETVTVPYQNTTNSAARTPFAAYSNIQPGARGSMFICLVWAAFSLPEPRWISIPIGFGFGYTSISDLAILLMPFVYSLYTRRRAHWNTAPLRLAIAAFFLATVFSTVIQYMSYGGELIWFVRAFRSLLPLYCALAIIYMGPRLESRRLIGHLAGSVAVSCVLAITFFLLNVDGSALLQYTLEDTGDVFSSGRMRNVNAGFGYLALALVSVIYSRQYGLSASPLRNLLLVCSVLSIIGAVLTFNRTFLLVAIVFVVVVVPVVGGIRALMTMVLVSILTVGVAILAYTNVEYVTRQVDRRIVEPLTTSSVAESVYYDNRDYHYQHYIITAQQYFLTGVPPDVSFLPDRQLTVTDISVVTVLLRNGVMACLLYLVAGCCLWYGLLLQRSHNATECARSVNNALLRAAPFMALASLNVDILARHYAVLFVAIFVVVLPGLGLDGVLRHKYRGSLVACA